MPAPPVKHSTKARCSIPHLGSSRYKFQRGVLTHTPETPTHKNTSEKGTHSYAMKTQNPLLRAHKAPFFSPLSFRFRRDQSQPRDQHSQLSRRLPSSNHGHFHHLPLPEAHRWHSTPRLRPARAPLLLLISLAHLSQLKQQIMSPLKTGSQTCPVHSCNFRQTSWLHFSVTGTTAHRRVTAWHQARRPLRLLQGSIPSRYSQLYTCTSFPERKLPPVPRSTCWHRAHCLCPHASLCLWMLTRTIS